MEPLSANDPRTIGEFRLHAQLGAGGMGQVYLGFSPAGRAVAIKVIHPQFARDQEFLRRFSHEVAAASAVGRSILSIRCARACDARELRCECIGYLLMCRDVMRR